jgi:hypothetical protein
MYNTDNRYIPIAISNPAAIGKREAVVGIFSVAHGILGYQKLTPQEVDNVKVQPMANSALRELEARGYAVCIIPAVGSTPNRKAF